MATLEGLEAVQAELARRLKLIGDVSDQAMKDNADHLLGAAMQRAPYELGDLEGSGDVRPLGDGEYEVGFYGQGIKAIVQHEDTTLNHPIKGEAKFLEGPFAENQDRYVQHVATSVKKVL